MNFSIKPMLVTPKYAEELLKMNVNNRKVRQSKVDSLAESMTKGEWELSNDAIVISEGNILLNGQHRLLAVVKSGVPCNFIVYTGASDSSFGIMDTPSVRRVSDVIYRMGGANATNADATVSKFINLNYDYRNGWETSWRYSCHVQATRKECIETYEKHAEDIQKWVNFANSIIGRGVALVSLSTIASFCLFLNLTLNHPEEKIRSFFTELIVDGATSHSTILHVRRKLLRNKMKTEVLPKDDVLRYVVRAWNDYVLGKQTSIVLTTSDSFRFIRPI